MASGRDSGAESGDPVAGALAAVVAGVDPGVNGGTLKDAGGDTFISGFFIRLITSIVTLATVGGITGVKSWFTSNAAKV